jgi:hypothetical protein
LYRLLLNFQHVFYHKFLILVLPILSLSSSRHTGDSTPLLSHQQQQQLTNDVSLLRLQLSGAQHRERLAMSALKNVRLLSDQLAESLAREARLANEISDLHEKLLQAEIHTSGASLPV